MMKQPAEPRNLDGRRCWLSLRAAPHVFSEHGAPGLHSESHLCQNEPLVPGQNGPVSTVQVPLDM